MQRLPAKLMFTLKTAQYSLSLAQTGKNLLPHSFLLLTKMRI